MLANPAVYCYNSAWYQKLPLSIIALVLYGVGIPFLIWVILYRIRNSTEESVHVERFGSVFACYARERWYWEVIVKGRKFLLVFCL
jgi:hypothetical protein